MPHWTARPDHSGRAVSTLGGLLLLGTFLVPAAGLRAQTVPLSGRVVDQRTGDPVSAATVRVVPGRGAELSRTDGAGVFHLDLPAGKYLVAVEREGYVTVRLDGVRVPMSDTAWVIHLEPQAATLDPWVGAARRGRVEPARESSASASVVGFEEAGAWGGGTTAADAVDGQPGLVVSSTGLTQRSVGVRAFSGLAPGGLLLLQDDRAAQPTSIRTNAYDLISSTLLDVERIEVLRGPASVFYGSDAGGGVLRIVTSSPIDRPGTAASVTVGERGLVQGAVRESVRFSSRAGLRITGQYAQGEDWAMDDSAEVVVRDPNAQRGGGQVRLDLRPWEDGEVVVAAGASSLLSSIGMRDRGAAQLTGWRQGFGQARVRKGQLFAQGFFNQADAGTSRDLRSDALIVEHSTMLGGQVQYGYSIPNVVELTGGLDASRTDPDTDGTTHGRWEDDDLITRWGAYAHAVATPVDRVNIMGALRVDRHSAFDDVILSPMVAVVFEQQPGRTFRASFNSGYSTPTPDVLFSDWVTSTIPLPDSLGFDVRVRGLPREGLTFDRRCPGGLDDRCMSSPFMPGVRLPATGAALWDNVLVPLALESPELLSALAALGISPQGFAQIVGHPGPGDLESKLMEWAGGSTFSPGSDPVPVPMLRPTITQSAEFGFRQVAGDRLALSLDVYATQIQDVVGPAQLATPTLFLDGSSVGAFLVGRLTGVGVPASLAQKIAAPVASAAAALPLGTMAPDQSDDPDILLAYRNVGDVRLWGANFGFRVLATDKVALLGSFSYLSKNCFDQDSDGFCGSPTDVTLNAPATHGALTVRWADPILGASVDGRVRHAGAFPMTWGVYQGQVDAHQLLDVNAQYRLPWVPGATVSVTVTNVLDAAHRDFVGAPLIGRLGMVRLLYAF